MISTKAKTVWEVAKTTDVVIVPTSIGWRSDGRAVFGLGLQRQVARRWPQLPAWYGNECRSRGERTGLIFWTPPPPRRWCAALALLPVRPLVAQNPHLGWLSKTELPMIREGLQTILRILHTCPPEVHFVLPMIGCLPSDKYKLSPDAVMELLASLHLDDRFILVDAEDA